MLHEELKDINYQIESKTDAQTEIENEITLWVHGEFNIDGLESIRVDYTGTGIDLVYSGIDGGETGLETTEAVTVIRNKLE